MEIIKKKIKGGNRNWKNFLDKDYLGHHNLEENEEMLLTIQKVVGEEKIKTADGDKIKVVLYFKEDVPKLILNVTTGNTISALYGTHPDGWIGKQIQAYTAKGIKAFGKEVEAIRIRDFKPRQDIDVEASKLKLEAATNVSELGIIWSTLSLADRSNKEIEAVKNVLKISLK
jgi:hypothetical protein